MLKGVYSVEAEGRKFVLFISLQDRVHTRPPPPLMATFYKNFLWWASELTAVCCAPPFISEGSILHTNPLETILKNFQFERTIRIII